MHQGEQVGETGLRRRDPRLKAQASHEIKLPLLALRRRQEHFLVEPGNFPEIKARSQSGEEAEQELLEKLLQQYLEPLVVIRRRGGGHEPIVAKKTARRMTYCP